MLDLRFRFWWRFESRLRLTPDCPARPELTQPLPQFRFVDFAIGGTRLLNFGAQRVGCLRPQRRVNAKLALAQPQLVALGVIVLKLDFVFLARQFFFGGKALLFLAQALKFRHAGIHHGNAKISKQLSPIITPRQCIG